VPLTPYSWIEDGETASPVSRRLSGRVQGGAKVEQCAGHFSVLLQGPLCMSPRSRIYIKDEWPKIPNQNKPRRPDHAVLGALAQRMLWDRGASLALHQGWALGAPQRKCSWEQTMTAAWEHAYGHARVCFEGQHVWDHVGSNGVCTLFLNTVHSPISCCSPLTFFNPNLKGLRLSGYVFLIYPENPNPFNSWHFWHQKGDFPH
jgi:hypothetical protein